MKSTAAVNPVSTSLGYVDEGYGGSAGRPGLILDRAEQLWAAVPVAWRRLGIALLGAGAASGVGWATSANPNASPPHIAVLIRVLIVGTLIGTGLFAQTSKVQTRMGGQLIAVGFFSAAWLLNGSSNPLLFSIGVLCSGLALPVFAYVMLAHPAGRMRSRTESRFAWGAGVVTATLWIPADLVARQPPLSTALIRCGARCPDNVLSLGSAASAPVALKAAVVLTWLAIGCGTPVLLFRRLRSASALLRGALIPVWVVGSTSGLLLAAYLGARVVGLAIASGLSTAYVAAAVALPVAFLVGLSIERLVMAQALAEFVAELGRQPDADPEALIASALGDQSLRIVYERPVVGTYVDCSGSVIGELPDNQAITRVQRERRPVAAVIYNRDLAGHERFVQAAGAAALMRLEKARLEADLKASNAELMASRVRLVETAHNERQRLERDLHDGVQQQLVGLRIKLDLAAEAVRDDPRKGGQDLASIGRQLDDALKALRRVAHGIYPELLHDRGLADALRAAGRDTPTPAMVRTTRIGRYREDVELAVYYCCLEALQNIVKHAGSRGAPRLTLWRDGPLLRFEVNDSGVGFDTRQTPNGGAGLVNMRDRIQTVGGMLEIASRRGRGTSVCGSVPVG